MQNATKKAFNPFYLLLLIVGTVFAITAFAYGVMALRLGQYQTASLPSASGAQLIHFLDKHGTSLLMGELAVLAVLTFGAIGTDEYWVRRAARRHSPAHESAATASKEQA